MESLLRWSIQNSTAQDGTPSDRPPVRREDLNPEIIDMILGKPDSELMKEDVAVAIDNSKTEDERINALDHLEMLIEQIDNANNLEKLKLWEPMQSLLTADVSTEVKVQALWVIGTAVQNNPAAQDVYLALNPLPTLLTFLTPSPESTIETRSKAIYALSGLLKHNNPAVKQLDNADVKGWNKLKDALQDPNISVRRKAVFLLNALLIPTSPVAHRESPLLIDSVPANPNAQVANTTTTEGPSINLLTPDRRPAPASQEPIHANSHAAQLRDAGRSQTSSTTLAALQKYDILETVVSSVVAPLPHGPDGENTDADHDYEEKAIRLLYTYTTACHGSLSPSQKQALKKWKEAELSKAGNQSQLAEKWNLTSQEYNVFVEGL